MHAHPMPSFPMHGIETAFMMGDMGAWYSAVPRARRRVGVIHAEEPAGGGGPANSAPTARSAVDRVDGVLHETCADADFVSHHQGREEFLAGHPGGDFGGRQDDGQNARARMPFHKTEAVIDVQGVLRKTVGKRGAHQ